MSDDQSAGHQEQVSDDQELAKVLAGVDEKLGDTVTTNSGPSSPLNSSQSSLPPVPPVGSNVVLPTPSVGTSAQPAPTTPAAQQSSPELDSIKKDALTELKPLVGKLNLPPEEKFDTLLLIIRSTDDQSLLAHAHDAAKAIPDETRRATALLDIIKEVDFFAGHKNPA